MSSPIDFNAIDLTTPYAPNYRIENKRLRTQVAEMREALELIAAQPTGVSCRRIARRTLASMEPK